MDFGFWVLGFGFWILGFGFWILGLGFWVMPSWRPLEPLPGSPYKPFSPGDGGFCNLLAFGGAEASEGPWRPLPRPLKTPLEGLEVLGSFWRPLKIRGPQTARKLWRVLSLETPQGGGRWGPLEAPGGSGGPWRPLEAPGGVKILVDVRKRRV